MNKKDKLKPTHEIIGFIKHNPSLINPEHVIIGYSDRFLGLQEIPFNDFYRVNESDDGIPLHRISYFIYNPEDKEPILIWEKDTKTNNLSLFTSNKGDDIDIINHDIPKKINKKNKVRFPITSSSNNNKHSFTSSLIWNVDYDDENEDNNDNNNDNEDDSKYDEGENIYDDYINNDEYYNIDYDYSEYLYDYDY